MSKIISSYNNKKFWKSKVFLTFFLLLGFWSLPATATVYVTSWKIVRVINAGTFEVTSPDLPANIKTVTLHLAIPDKLLLPRLLPRNASAQPGYCGREYDAAVKAQQYVQDIINKKINDPDALDIGIINQDELEKIEAGKSTEAKVEILVDGKSLVELLKEKDFLRVHWCI